MVASLPVAPLQAVWDLPCDLVGFLDRQGRVQGVGMGWGDRGWSPTLGDSWLTFLHPQDRILADYQLQQLLAQPGLGPHRLQFEGRLVPLPTGEGDGKSGVERASWHLALLPEDPNTLHLLIRPLGRVSGTADQRLPGGHLAGLTGLTEGLAGPIVSGEGTGVAVGEGESKGESEGGGEGGSAGQEAGQGASQSGDAWRDVFWVYDPIAQQQLYVSPSYEHVWGRSCQTAYEDATALQSAIHPEDQAYVTRALAEGQDQVCVALDYRIVRPDGSVRWIHDRSFPIRDDQGRVYRFVGVAEDITERRQTEAACDHLFEQLSAQRQTLERQISQHTAELRAIIDGIPDEIYVVRRDTLEIAYCNLAFARAMGGSHPDQFEGHLLRDCISQTYPQVQVERILRHAQIVFDAGENQEIQTSRFRGDRAHTFEVTNVPLRDAAGQVYAMVSATRDISALRDSEEQLRAIFEQAAVGISLVNVDGQFQAVNQKFCDLMGYRREELLELTFQQITDPHHLQADLDQYQRLLTGEIDSFMLEKCFIRKDKQLQWATLTVSGVYGDDGQMKYDIGVLQDVSDRKRAEAEMLNALENERELNELKSRVISMISHEYRTPLTIICSSAELLQRYGYDWAEERRTTHFDRIQSSVEHLTALVNDVLFLNRAEANRQEFNPTYLDIREFFREIGDTMRVNFRNEHDLVLDCPVDGQPVCVDEKLLRQIVTNLLSNAVKYSPEKTVIHCRVAVDNRLLRLSVQDQGIGIPLEDQGRLYEFFHRAKNVGAVPGTGLGLSIVRQCVDIHQGTIEVESELGKGTTFTVTLPCFSPGC